METQKYIIRQNGKEYLVSLLAINDKIRVQCQENNFSLSPITFIRDYSLNELLSLSNLFNKFPDLLYIQKELNNAIEMEQQIKEILSKYSEQCNYIYVDRGPRVVFDGLLQEINNKFSKSFSFKDLLSNKDHLYFATKDWLPNELGSFNDCKKAMFESLQQALKNKIK